MRLGSLCTGYGGLDEAVHAVLGTELAWTSDIDPGACRIIAHRHGGVPNIGDMTTVDWSTLEPVDVLTAGYPCQPFSHAGRRKGTDDVRHLWPFIREAVRRIRPRITVLENVAGHRSLGFDRVLGDLAEDGLYVRWASLRAADIGACHGRDRVFLLAASNASFDGWDEGWPESAGQLGRPDASERDPADGMSLLPTPRSTRGGSATEMMYGLGGERSDADRPQGRILLPTPAAREPGGTIKQYHARLKEHDGRESTFAPLSMAVQLVDFGQYAAAVDRWATILGRPAPEPTEPTGRGNAHRLSPRFVEWMMGLPDGWVTDVPDLSRNQQLKALGNGVVPQQAEAALRMLLGAGGVATPTDHHASLLPTPRGQDSDESPETFDARTDALQEGGRNGGKTGTPLGVEVQRLTAP